ncbi:hypothetical protein D3C75_583420 [compost metagenome]
MLTLLNQTVILVLNPEVAGLTTYPLLTVVQMIYAAQIFERADAFFTLILFIGLDVNHVHLFYRLPSGCKDSLQLDIKYG